MEDDAEIDGAMVRVPRAIRQVRSIARRTGREDGLPEGIRRKSAWQILNETGDPRLSMLRKFAAAVGCSVKSLV